MKVRRAMQRAWPEGIDTAVNPGAENAQLMVPVGIIPEPHGYPTLGDNLQTNRVSQSSDTT